MFEMFLTNRAEKALKSFIKKLKDMKNTYRLRIGNYRIIYTVDFNKFQIFVSSIILRKKAY